MGCRCLRREDSESESGSELDVEEVGDEEDVVEEVPNGSLYGARPDGDDGWEGLESYG